MINPASLWTKFSYGSLFTMNDRHHVWTEDPNVTKKFRWYNDRLVIEVDNGTGISRGVFFTRNISSFSYNL